MIDVVAVLQDHSSDWVQEDPYAGACDRELILKRLQSRIGYLDVAAAGARFWGLLAGTNYGLSNANDAQFKINVPSIAIR